MTEYKRALVSYNVKSEFLALHPQLNNVMINSIALQDLTGPLGNPFIAFAVDQEGAKI